MELPTRGGTYCAGGDCVPCVVDAHCGPDCESCPSMGQFCAAEGTHCIDCDESHSCLAGKVCEAGECVACTPNCAGKECGSDECGGACGICSDCEVCDNGFCTLDPSCFGCSDITREGFLSTSDYPLIAACGGAWNIPGIHNETPACNREAGNTGLNAEGTGCNVTDLCSEGWHVCLGKNDVLYRSPLGCTEIMDGAPSPAFFLTRTSSTGAFNCSPDTIGSPTTVNDIFGCGDLGCPPNGATCYPLTQASHDGCKSLNNKPTESCTCAFQGPDVVCTPTSGGCGWCSPLDYFNVLLGVYHPDAWDCGGSNSSEANLVVKTHPEQQGGVLCCRDECVSEGDCPVGETCVMQTCQPRP